ncbi:hypothetical protein BROC_00898 [Candidatus Brocadiaceae bacterium]|nr:hypothetical protein BROC_00898 [Candidatus Brocadiaceae bacterium]
MKNSSAISLKTNNTPGETEGARRATGVSPGGAIQSDHFPDPEVTEKAVRRKFTAKYKLRILQEAEVCATQGQMGALLRREGLYSSKSHYVASSTQTRGTGSAFPKASWSKDEKY